MKDYTREAVGRQLGAMRCRRYEFTFRREKTGEAGRSPGTRRVHEGERHSEGAVRQCRCRHLWETSVDTALSFCPETEGRDP